MFSCNISSKFQNNLSNYLEGRKEKRNSKFSLAILNFSKAFSIKVSQRGVKKSVRLSRKERSTLQVMIKMKMIIITIKMENNGNGQRRIQAYSYSVKHLRWSFLRNKFMFYIC